MAKSLDKAIKLCDLDSNPYKDDKIRKAIGPYTIKWDKSDGYFKVRKNGKVVAQNSDYYEARNTAFRLYSIDNLKWD